MKKLKFLAVALFTVLTCVNFASCSDDDDEISGNSIVGVWIEKGVDDGEAYENTYIFNEDGSGSVQWNGNYDESFSYVYTAPRLTIDWDYGEHEILSVEWINKNTIHLYDNDGEDFTLSRQ